MINKIKNKIERFKDWYVWKFENPYNLNMPAGNCPVQIEGKLKDGKYYYFRARWSTWSLDLAWSEREWMNRIPLIFKYSDQYGTDSAAGWMTKREAIKFATIALNKYYGTKN